MAITKTKPKKRNQINVTALDPEIMEKLSAIAEAEERTLAQVGRIAFRHFIEAREKKDVA